MDEIVGDDAESHPALHPVQAAIAATIQSVATFQHADTAFAPGPPFLSGAEPTPLLQLPPFFAVRAAVGNGDPRHSQFLHLFFVCLGIEARIRRDQSRDPSEPPLMFFDGWYQ